MSTGFILSNKLNVCRFSFILTLFITVTALKACSQSVHTKFFMSGIMEKTILEKQAGGALYVQFPSLWRAGVFYQTTFDNKIEGTTNGTYWGSMVAAPLVKSGKLNFYAQLRAGFVDNRFFVAAPGVITEVKITHHLSADVGLSIRKGYLSATTNLNFRF